MSAITTGAPKMAVTALMESSTGENSVRAIKSQPAQKMAPPKKHAGITRMGFDDFSATHIWTKNFRNGYRTIFVLIVFKNSSDGTSNS